MSECFWNDCDDELTAYFFDRLGPGGLYADLTIVQAVAVGLRDTAQWEKWAVDNLLPAVIVMGIDGRAATDEHGGLLLHLAKSYPYVAVAVLEGTADEALRGAKTLARRIEKALATKRMIEAVAEDGERANQQVILPGESFVAVAQRRTSDADRWFGIGGYSFTIQTAG